MNDKKIMTDDRVLELDKKRMALEEEELAITDELISSSDGKDPMGISTPLVDDEGYPRNDIDIYRARSLRKRLNEIKFDHSLIMKKIEELLAEQRESQNEKEIQSRKKKKPKPKFDPLTQKWVVPNWDGSIKGDLSGNVRKFEDIGKDHIMNADQLEKCGQKVLQQSFQGLTTQTPFARVEKVLPNSPAFEAKLQVDDEIVTFGMVNYSNNRQLNAMGDVVSRALSNNENILITLIRNKDSNSNGNGRMTSVQLTPKKWEGQGSVGCIFSPIM